MLKCIATICPGNRFMKRIAFLPVLISMCILSACSADSSSSANAFTRVEEPRHLSVIYGYDIHGDVLGDKPEFDYCRNDKVTYSSYVGNSGQQTLPAGTKTIMEKTYSMIPTEITGKDAPTLVLYSEDTYIDVYVSGSQAHFIQRLPSYEDLGIFYSK